MTLETMTAEVDDGYVILDEDFELVTISTENFYVLDTFALSEEEYEDYICGDIDLRKKVVATKGIILRSALHRALGRADSSNQEPDKDDA